ncbi:hypothetical protein LMH87_004672 [Akanthomyces muscarius]|uniref:Ricin B-related lectin n=2 Tax=Akanthomyces TaxID=150366 RepID=A0A168H561_CORDF|nr:hypothetical protein LMH87_004672 [Akanthomyces muscarius]KAJ4145840.1 hypothetical protein LMH87_004672 [Akanthomyces muscarius]OAA77315.1 Ricin B-related lectin [Akanthomyces lecanii RCEF 1005]
MSFPEGEFTIRNRASGRVLDVAYMSTEAGGSIIAWEFKGDDDNTNQRWKLDDGHLINIHSGLALSFNDISHEAGATQEDANGGEGQLFEYNDGIISLASNGDFVVGEWDGDVKLVNRDDYDDARRWDF